MVGVLDLGFYLSDRTSRPGWTGPETAVVAPPGAGLDSGPLLDALSRAPLPPGHLLVATSGSTSTEGSAIRLVALSREAFLASAEAVNAHLSVTPADIWAHALPLFHVGGLGILARAHLSGSRVVAAVDRKWDARRYRDRVADTRSTLSALVPSQVYDLAEAGLRSPASLRAIVVGGGRLEPTLYSAARELGWACLPSYGMTETCSQVATASPDAFPDACPETLPILSHAQLRAGPDGRLHVRAASLLTCYVTAGSAGEPVTLDDPRRDGWFETEDLGRLLPGGVEVAGRASDSVKVRGELVSLTAVEAAIGRWLDRDHASRAAVADFAVVSTPHPRLGAELLLTVVPRPGMAPGVQTGRLEDGLAGFLAPFERPSRIVLVDAIPRTALGKVQRGRLSEQVRTAGR